MFSIAEALSRHKPKNGRFFTIAIDGRGSSGKTTLLEYLKTHYPGFTYLHGDDYFHRIADEVLWGGFDEERFQHDVVDSLQSGNVFTHRAYDFQNDTWSKPRIRHIHTAFCLERVGSFDIGIDWDLKIWVETPKDTCARWGISRDRAFIPYDRVVAAWMQWQKAEDAYIEKLQPIRQADIVVYGMTDFSRQIM